MAHALLQPTAVLVGDTDYAPDAFAARCLLSEAGKDDSKCSIRVCLFSLEAAKSNPALCETIRHKSFPSRKQ